MTASFAMAMDRNDRCKTSIGPVAVQRVRLRDRDADQAVERIRFTSGILPRWAWWTRSLDASLPIL